MRAFLRLTCAIAVVFAFTDVPVSHDIRIGTGISLAQLQKCNFCNEALSLAAVRTARPLLSRTRLLKATFQRSESTVSGKRSYETQPVRRSISNRGNALSQATSNAFHQELPESPVRHTWPQWTRIGLVFLAVALAASIMHKPAGLSRVVAVIHVVILVTVLINSSSDRPIPWDQTIVDRALHSLSHEGTRIGTLSYLAGALAKVGHRGAALAVAQEARNMLRHLEAVDVGYVQLFGDVLLRDLVLAFEWAQDQQAANAQLSLIHNPYRKSEAIAQQALAKAQAGDTARATELFVAALEQLTLAKGMLLGRVDLAPEYAAISPTLYKQLLVVTEATLPTLIEIAHCQYSAGFTEDALRTSNAVLGFLVEQVKNGADGYESLDVANQLSVLLLGQPGNAALAKSIHTLAGELPLMSSGIHWTDTVNMGVAMVWASLGYAWGQAEEIAAARRAFEYALDASRSLSANDCIWPLCSSVKLQSDLHFHEGVQTALREVERRTEHLKDLSPEAPGELLVTILRAGELDWAERLDRSYPAIDVLPDQLAEAAMIAGNTSKAFVYAEEAKANECLYSQALDVIIRQVIGPLDKLRPRYPTGTSTTRRLMSIFVLMASEAALWCAGEGTFHPSHLPGSLDPGYCVSQRLSSAA